MGKNADERHAGAAIPSHCAWHDVVVVGIGRLNVGHQFPGLVNVASEFAHAL